MELTRDVTVTGPFAFDSFTRSFSGGWGTANVGGAWTRIGSSALFAVADGTGSIRNATKGTGAAAHLNDVSSLNTDLSLRFSLDKVATGGGQFVYVTGRGASNDAYRAKLNVSSTGAVRLFLTKVIAGVETDLASKTISGLTAQAGTFYSVRLQVWGATPTNLRARVWTATDSEPSEWAVSATDGATPLQSAGAIGLRTYLSGTADNAPTTVLFDDVIARLVGN